MQRSSKNGQAAICLLRTPFYTIYEPTNAQKNQNSKIVKKDSKNMSRKMVIFVEITLDENAIFVYNDVTKNYIIQRRG